ncbi:2Fe-2S iron-sulfur cluster binding domain-containing protein [Pectobacterium parvum]|uniref:2Fe-2S iron-sulfur cluster binding domain-containing protein n=2 Tax=Pectobacteriaceae TaxID=1903410 RepID=A0AAP9LBH8_9GAMM|nr:2Fe-2S iron-sulfur cluster binding domain-containing protein [Pectobacterium parvum]
MDECFFWSWRFFMSEIIKSDCYQVFFEGVDIGLCRSDISLLDSLEVKGLNIPSLCRKGQCGCCKIILLRGHVHQNNQTSLTDDEIKENVILACCSYPKSDAEFELY